MPLDTQGNEIVAPSGDAAPTSAEQTPPGGEETPKVVPEYVTAEQFNTQQTQTNQLLAGLQGSMNALTQLQAGSLNAPAMPPEPAPLSLPTNTQLAEAIDEGRAGDVISQYVNAGIQQASRELDKTVIQPLRTELEQTRNLAAESSAASISGQMPYYQQFKQQIDGVVANLQPHERTGANMKAAYDMVIGQNIQAVINLETEAAARRNTAAPVDAAPIPGQVVQRPNAQPTGNTVLTPMDLGGEGAVAALASTNQTADGKAQRMGYANWADYMAKTLGSEGGDV